MVRSSLTGHDHAPRRTNLALVGGSLRARDALGELLQGEPGIEVVAASSRLDELVPSLATPPDLALVDVRLPDVDTVLASREFRGQFPASRVLLLSTHANAGMVAALTVSGASGYVQKTLNTTALAATLNDAALGRRDRVAWQAAAGVVRWVESGLSEGADRPSQLESHLDLLRLLATGHGDREICVQLDFDLATTRRRIAQLYVDLHSDPAFRSVGSDLARLLL